MLPSFYRMIHQIMYQNHSVDQLYPYEFECLEYRHSLLEWNTCKLNTSIPTTNCWKIITSHDTCSIEQRLSLQYSCCRFYKLMRISVDPTIQIYKRWAHHSPWNERHYQFLRCPTSRSAFHVTASHAWICPRIQLISLFIIITIMGKDSCGTNLNYFLHHEFFIC